jgi:predicted adenylyl cyclase CyaB
MLRTNVEFKAYCDKPSDSIETACSALGVDSSHTTLQTDTYFRARKGRLSLRTDELGSRLLFYDRPDTPTPRESRSQLIALSSTDDPVVDLLTKSLGVRCTIEKQRQVYQRDGTSIHLDDVEGLGRFLDVVIDVERVGGPAPALERSQEILDRVGLSLADIVPWSYAELHNMTAAAVRWRAKRMAAGEAGTLFLLDGASCSGKSTLVDWLTCDSGLPISLVPRYSTRARRKDDGRRGTEYIFVSHEAFRDLAFEGGFIEYRDFQFGMSYGLPWAEAFAPLMEGRQALGVINLGNVRHVKTVLPEAVTILVDASQEAIRARLIARGVNTPEQIAERLANAARVDTYRPLYNHIVRNEDGSLRQAEEFLRELIVGVKKAG